jgi:hypothetical protein
MSNIAGGAASGAAVGTAIEPGFGTAIGAAAGGLLSAFGGGGGGSAPSNTNDDQIGAGGAEQLGPYNIGQEPVFTPFSNTVAVQSGAQTDPLSQTVGLLQQLNSSPLQVAVGGAIQSTAARGASTARTVEQANSPLTTYAPYIAIGVGLLSLILFFKGRRS